MPALLVFLWFAGLMAAADLTGIWIGQVEGRNAPVDIAFQFRQTGARLEGKLYGDSLSAPIVEGIVAGETIRFSVVTQEQAGNQIHETRLRFEGTLKNGALVMKRERESATNAGNGGAVQPRNDAAVVFQLKRLI